MCVCVCVSKSAQSKSCQELLFLITPWVPATPPLPPPPTPPPPDPFALVSSRRGMRSTRGQFPGSPRKGAACQQGARRDLNGEGRAGRSGGQEESLNQELAKCSGAGPRYESAPRPLTLRWLDPEVHLRSGNVCVWTSMRVSGLNPQNLNPANIIGMKTAIQ